MIESSDCFYSNCLLEALKAKIRHPLKAKITFIPKSESGCCHFMWSDGEHDYDFGAERHFRWFDNFLFKGCIRQRELGSNERYKRKMKNHYKKRLTK